MAIDVSKHVKIQVKGISNNVLLCAVAEILHSINNCQEFDFKATYIQLHFTTDVEHNFIDDICCELVAKLQKNVNSRLNVSIYFKSGRWFIKISNPN